MALMGQISLAFLFLLGSAFAGEESLSFEKILKNTLENNAQILESAQDIEVARQQLERANAALWPTASALILAAPLFEERGNAVSSVINTGKWGPFLKAGFQVVQPLYTFGQISNYQKAAEGQIAANTQLTEMKRAEVILTAKEFYYGYLMASSFEDLLKDLVDTLEEAVKTVEESKNQKRKNAVKPHDLYNLKTNLEDLRQKQLLARASCKTAERAVAWISATAFETLGERRFAPEPYTLKTLDQYLALAKAHRPEFKALRAGQQARQALADAKKAQDYPILFVGAFASYGWSPVRDRQPSNYANDPFNRLEGGAGLGLKFDLEFKRHSAEAAEQMAETMKLKAKESYAVPGIELEVKKAFWEVEQAIASLKIAEKRKSLGRKWFVSNGLGWSIGVTSAKDLMEALEGNGLARRNYIETVYLLNLSLARLTKAVGQEVTELVYR